MENDVGNGVVIAVSWPAWYTFPPKKKAGDTDSDRGKPVSKPGKGKHQINIPKPVPHMKAHSIPMPYLLGSDFDTTCA